jgi:hypothetical protein
MSTRAHREAVVRRERELLSRGPMSDEEEATFASQQAAQDRAAWLRRHPELAEPELPLEKAA